MNHLIRTILASLILIVCHSLAAIDNPHFYKAPYLHATKSWNKTEWLAIIDAHYAAGSSHRSRNRENNAVGTFDLYGNHNLLYLTANVDQPTDISMLIQGYVNAIDAKRTAFENAVPEDKANFGCVEFCGACEVDELVINYRQNFVCNLFAELNMPIRRVKTGPITLADRSPAGSQTDILYTQQDPVWIDFRDNLDDILRAYGMSGYACSSKSTNFGDISLLVGWQRQIIKKTSFFSYTDLAIKGGILFPTGAHRKFQDPFSIETGYNDHWGFPVRIDALYGLSNDIIIGTYLGVLIFSSKEHTNVPVKTHENQNGFIKLYRTTVNEKKGTLFDIGTYLKLDHFFKGLSLITGYSYTRQAGDTLEVEDCAETNNILINNDCRLRSWQMHALHVLAQYDLGVHEMFKKRDWKPRFGLFYDYPLKGKRVIMNAMLGGSIGCDLTWNF